jgi:hypothetical protein
MYSNPKFIEWIVDLVMTHEGLNIILILLLV